MSAPAPAVSVVVTTYRRPFAAARAVASILASRHDRFELVLVDQNSDNLSSDALGSWMTDPRLRYLRNNACGASAARNRATSAARGELIAYTDDDCEVEPGWLEALEQAFRSELAPDVVLGQVLACPHDAGSGFVPACARPASRITGSLQERPQIEVMGACMAIRRSVWEALDGFAEWMGPGTRAPAGEDYDLVVRALLSGKRVLETSAPVVVHHGFRTLAEGLQLIDAYTRCTAMVLGVRLRRQPTLLARCLIRLGWSFLWSGSSIIASTRVIPSRGRRLAAFSQGLVTGLMAAAVRPVPS